MERLNDMFQKIRDLFPEKEAVRKKFLGVEKNVSFTLFLNSLLTIFPPIDQEPLRFDREAAEHAQH